MREYEVAFPYDNDETIKKKIDYIVSMVGEENVTMETKIKIIEPSNYGSIRIRTTNDIWEEIRFQLELELIYC